MQAGVEQAAASHRVADSGDQDGRGEFTVVLQPGEFLLLQKLLPPFPGFETLFGQFLPGLFPAAVPVERDLAVQQPLGAFLPVLRRFRRVTAFEQRLLFLPAQPFVMIQLFFPVFYRFPPPAQWFRAEFSFCRCGAAIRTFCNPFHIWGAPAKKRYAQLSRHHRHLQARTTQKEERTKGTPDPCRVVPENASFVVSTHQSGYSVFRYQSAM